MAKGTKLFQAPGSPLIQGRSRLQRPWWQPYLTSVVLGLAWPIASLAPVALFGHEDSPGVVDPLLETVGVWVSQLPVLVPAVLLGAGVGVFIGHAWGMRHRWISGTVAAVSAWYLALVLVSLFG